MVVDAIVQLHAGLHGINHILLRAVAANRGVHIFRSAVHGAEGRQRVQHQTDARIAQLIHGEQRGGTEFGDIGQDGHFYRIGKGAIHFQAGNGFGENHVRPGFHASHGTLHSGVQPFHRQRIGAGHDDEIFIGTRIHSSLDAIDHFLLGDDFLIGAMTATLGADLIFNVNGGCAELHHGAHGTGDVEGGGAKAGIHIHQ